MSQPSLFGEDPRVPTWPEARCGLCVHRNAAHPGVPTGFCAPLGQRRHTNEAPCDQRFGREQLILACDKQARQ